MGRIHEQIEAFGVDHCLDQAKAQNAKSRNLEMIEAAARAISEPDEAPYFTHTGLAQTVLPHTKLESDDTIWHRSAGRFDLMVSPGTIKDPQTGKPRRVGVPYGTRARLIMLYLQTEGQKSRLVSMGNSMSAWIRSLGLKVTGGARGTIQPIKDQALRIGRCTFTMQFEDSAPNGGLIIKDKQIVDKLSLWVVDEDTTWPDAVELSEEFHHHLRDQSMPLAPHAIGHLRGTSLGLDLYAILAFRLPRLKQRTHLNWRVLRTMFGYDTMPNKSFARKIRETLPHVLAVYPDARVDMDHKGLALYPSNYAVSKSTVVAMLPK